MWFSYGVDAFVRAARRYCLSAPEAGFVDIFRWPLWRGGAAAWPPVTATDCVASTANFGFSGEFVRDVRLVSFAESEVRDVLGFFGFVYRETQFTFNGWWENIYPSHSSDSLNRWYHVAFFSSSSFCCAVLTPTRLCTFCFSHAHFFFLIWHVVLMQNDKTGACECVRWIYFLNCRWFLCVCLCVRMQKSAVYSSDWYPPALWMHLFEPAPGHLVLRSLDATRNQTGAAGSFPSFYSVISSITSGYSVFMSWFAHPANTLMYILRPKHLQIQVTHGEHL